MKKYLLICLLPFVFGCSVSQPEPEYVLVAPEDTMITECPMEKPPKVEDFMKATSVGQLMMMTEAYNSQTKNVEICNTHLKGLKMWKEEQLKNYNKP